MSEPAVFGLIRDGQPRFYGDRWAVVFLHREILFGPDDFEAWVTQLEELDEWSDECSGGAVADYDRKKLVWYAEVEPLRIPRLSAIYQRLLQAAWPGFDVAFAHQGMRELSKAVGIDAPGETYGDQQPETVREAARIHDQEEPEDSEADEEGEETAHFDEEENRAWVTVVAADGAVRHRQLEHLPADLLNANNEPLSALRDLPPAEVPPEAVVVEGMWINEPKKSIGVWGARALHEKLPDIRKGWEGWTVEWAERGYEEQCQVAGPAGVPLREAEALAKLLPTILSTKRFDISTVLGALGGGLKKTAMKATGCLLIVLCLPLVIFGLVSGNWKAVLISIAITCAVVIAAFKMIERRVKRSFASKVPGAGDDRAPPAAGPLEEPLRRQRIDQLLIAAGLPRLVEVEPLFPKKSELDLLGS
ncbi:MAG: hypothetical protein HUU20_12760 [Pirellulales bacterium]|nr:hypothetical protein [Pirellulales bacterium]